MQQGVLPLFASNFLDKYKMLKKLLLLASVLLLSGCMGLAFCNEKGEPKGCHAWDPATKNGAGGRS